MKKIVSAVALAAVAASLATAEVSLGVNARVYSDVFTYATSTEKNQRTNDTNGEGTDDNGTITTAKDTKHADDVTLAASGEKSGAKIVFNVTSSAATTPDAEGSATDVNLTSYQLWTQLGKVRLDAGAYDQRLSKALNNDGNWGNNYSGSQKPGIWKAFGKTSAVWAKDAGNITAVKGAKKTTNFQASGKVADNLTLRGVLFLGSNGTKNNDGDDDVSNPWIFTPFAVGGVYKIDDASQLAFVGKLAHIAQQTATIPQESIWTLQFDYYNKLSDAIEIEAAYTLGAAIYTNNGSTSTGDWVTLNNGTKAQDNDQFAHGFDFRIKDQLSSQLSLTGIVGVNYVQATAITKRTNDNTSGAAYRDSLAKSYATGAAGTLAYYATLGVDYKASGLITYQVQSKIENSNLFDVSTGDSSVAQVDYYKNTTVNVRPAILVNPDKNSQLFAGVDFKFSGFLRNATGKNNTFQTTTSIPVGLRVKL